MAKLTPKQELFAQTYIKTGNASEAYRTAYDANPKSCGCLIGKPKTVDIETNINQIESIPKTHKRRLF